MKNIVHSYVRKFREERRKSRRAVALLLALALVVTTGVNWQLHSTGIAMTNETYCGLEEHTHTEDCYEEVLVCSQEESEGHTHTDECYETEKVLVCDLEEDEDHTHTDECYETEKVLVCDQEESEGHTHTEDCYETQLVCDKEEHTHTVDCLTDETADVETASDWEATLPDLTGVLADDVVAVAKSQLGYTESTANFTLDEDGTTRKGYTRYGAWYGNEYGDWDAMFASFCLYYADVDEDTFPQAGGAYSWTVALDELGLYDEDAEPANGDLVFFDTDADGKADHVGIVAGVSEYKVTVIEGDSDDKVQSNAYSLSDSTITGYGVLPEQEESEAEEKATETETTTLTYEGEDFTVTATYGADAELPEGVELIASEYAKDSETYQSRYDEAAELYGWEEDMSDSVRLFNVGFYLDGEEIEPAAEVEVVIAYADQDGLTNYTVTHFGETTEEVTAESNYEDGTQTVTFGLDAFSDIMVSAAVSESEEVTTVGEEGDLDAIQALADSGYFDYWENLLEDEDSDSQITLSASNFSLRSMISAVVGSGSTTSSSQITEEGGSNSNDDGSVTVSKTIAGTDTENVFDITLEVETTTNVSELYTEPDMAVVIVMDISNSMASTYGNTTRYAAAVESAEAFLDQFATETNGVSQVGFVAFNTDAMEVFGMSSCGTVEEATALKDTMRTATGEVMQKYVDGRASLDADEAAKIAYTNYYVTNRFTNIEAGLKMASDMLDDATNENKYIIFISDGFPTTYMKDNTSTTDYSGYNPYMSSKYNSEYSSLVKYGDGYFYNINTNEQCTGGTSYSDEAAIRARKMAEKIKENGTTIFSVGVDIGGQTISGYNSYNVDTQVSEYEYEIGSASNADAYKDWLKNKIGSGYYYDAEDPDSLKTAFSGIVESIQSLNEQSAQAQWVATDPLPTFSENTDTTVEFLGFYDNEDVLQVYEPNYTLTGSNAAGGENTAAYTADSSSISWDLKKSGYTTSNSGGTTTYTYTLTYRVRLQNESEDFEEELSYATNGEASLTYLKVTTEDGKTVTEEHTLDFPVPEVKGYLGELTFTKVNEDGDVLSGATFTLSHDTDTCGNCRGDGESSVDVEDMTATSGEDGVVTFTNIPSGHTYTLTETSAPDGYTASTKTYTVTVAYGVVTVTDDSGEDWDGTVVNYEEPVPTVEKKVQNSENDWVDKNTAGFDDRVQYKTTISNLTGATNLVLHDVLSDGLTDPYVISVFVVDENGETVKSLTENTDYVITYYTSPNEDNCDFEITFTDESISALTSSQSIVVRYRATVTSDAVIAGEGNPNETYISYGADSYSDHDTVVTYVYEVDVHKYSGEESLSGAKFVLYKYVTVGVGEGDQTYTGKSYAVVDASNKLTGWTGYLAYDSVNNTDYWNEDKDGATTLTTDSSGMIYIKGIAPGTYYLEETQAPDGYVLLDEPIEITLKEDGSITYVVDGATKTVTNSIVEVENEASYELPEAGGMGTWLYSLMGVILCSGAALVLMKRREIE